MEKDLAGTLDYAPPEQMGQSEIEVGPYSDVYSFGRTLNMIFFNQLKPTPKMIRDFPNQELVDLVSDCQEEEPKNRPQNFSEVLKRLEKLDGGSRVVATSPTPSQTPFEKLAQAVQNSLTSQNRVAPRNLAIPQAMLIPTEPQPKMPPQPQPKVPAYAETSADGRFQRTNAGVIWDTKTKLEWIVGPDQNMSWDQAKAWVEQQTVDGGGWRMPNREELKGILADSKKSFWNGDGLYIDPIFKMTGHYVWSGVLNGSSGAWLVYFNLGVELSGNRSGSDNARAVGSRARR